MGVSPGKAVPSALPGLNLYWSDRREQPMLEWEKWIELSTVAMIAEHSIFVKKLTRTEGVEQVPALMGSLAEEAACKKLNNIFFLSIGQAARKTLLDNFPTMQTYNLLPYLCKSCWSDVGKHSC